MQRQIVESYLQVHIMESAKNHLVDTTIRYQFKEKEICSYQRTLRTEEIESARRTWIKQIQSAHEETNKFKQDKERLNLQKYQHGIYVCIGRVEGDYPIYLPMNDVFSQKLVEHSHKKTLHGGVGFTITEVRRHYWIQKDK